MAYIAALALTLARKPKLAPYAASILYRTLGPRYGRAASVITLLPISMAYAAKHREAVARSGLAGNKFNLRPGRNLYLLSSGTGLAPFMSTIQDPEYYESYEHIVLVHGVRHVSELGYRQFISEVLPRHEYLGDLVKGQLRYFPTVTREAFTQQGRITDLLDQGDITRSLGLPDMDPHLDRVMICGNPGLLTDLTAILERLGFDEGSMNKQGAYVIERAFVEK